jgi:ketosteroid isomerase-like protein
MKHTRAWLVCAFFGAAGIAAADAPTALEKEFTALENSWGEAVIKRDTAYLEKLYAAEYRFVDPGGGVADRAKDIGDTKAGVFKLSAFKLDEIKVHQYGIVVVVTGSNALTATADGKDASGVYRFTDVFVKRDGRWQCVATQATRVQGP